MTADSEKQSKLPNTVMTPFLKYWALFRLALLALLITGIYQSLAATGLLEQDKPEDIRAVIQQWGAYSVLAYLLIFTLGQLIYMPGIIFIAAAPLIFGMGLGFVYGMLGAVVSVSISFFLVRTIGGKPLSNPRKPWIKRLLSSLEASPFRSIFYLRLFFGTAPWLNYGLAMSQVSYRHYISATVLGFTPQLILTLFFSDWLIALFR